MLDKNCVCPTHFFAKNVFDKKCVHLTCFLQGEHMFIKNMEGEHKCVVIEILEQNIENLFLAVFSRDYKNESVNKKYFFTYNINICVIFVMFIFKKRI